MNIEYSDEFMRIEPHEWHIFATSKSFNNTDLKHAKLYLACSGNYCYKMLIIKRNKHKNPVPHCFIHHVPYDRIMWELMEEKLVFPKYKKEKEKVIYKTIKFVDDIDPEVQVEIYRPPTCESPRTKVKKVPQVTPEKKYEKVPRQNNKRKKLFTEEGRESPILSVDELNEIFKDEPDLLNFDA